MIATAVGLLLLVGNPVTIPPSNQKFIAAEKLKVDVTDSAELKISYLEDSLKNWFLDKVEESFTASQLKVQKLSQNSVDGPILSELGGKEKAETTLYEMFSFLKTAEQKWCIFYIKDASERLRPVSAYWDEDGWSLDAGELHGPDEWDAGARMVSRN